MIAPIEFDRAHPAEAYWLAHLIADAFHDLPPSRWLIPDPFDRREFMPGYFQVLVDHAIANGAVYTTIDRHAVALWLPIAPGFTRVLPDYDTRLAVACGGYVERFRLFDTVLDKHHPHEVAHHHLAILAVTPHRQGHGIGSALLTSYHQMLDNLDLPAYLEAAGPRSRDLYLRHGYIDLAEPFALPEGGPPMWAMWRPPRPVTDDVPGHLR